MPIQTQPSILRGSILTIVCGLSACAILGCSLFKANESREREIVASLDGIENKSKLGDHKPEKVRFDAGVLLGDTENPAFQAETFGPVLTELISQSKWRSLFEIVGSYPEVTVSVLMDPNGLGLTWSQASTVAKYFDAHLESGANPQQPWQNFIAALATEDGDFLQIRKEFLSSLSQNQPTAALKLGLVRSVGRSSPDLLRAESHRLEGIACLMLERYSESIRHFESGIEEVAETNPFFATKIGLLLGEAERHAKKDINWKRTWQATVSTQAKWLNTSVFDPGFWKKAAFLRPVNVDWPEPAVAAMKQMLAERGLDFQTGLSSSSEAVVWATIGMQSLVRHESQNAILAFKKAESLVSSSGLKNELQMQQALAMTDGGQNGPASAILLRLSSGKGLLADRAKAILATMKLQNGSVAQGMNLLQSAVKSAQQWPVEERLKAHADYGLALLMRGREQEGVRLLNQVFDQFVSNNNYDHAGQCLWNLAKYFETKENEASYKNYLDRIRAFEQTL